MIWKRIRSTSLVIMEFERQFGGEIKDEDAQKIETVGAAIEYIKERM